MKKRLLSLCVILALALGLLSLPAAASGSSPESTAHADQLHTLHLFQGTANGYALDNTPTRLHGLIMLIRLLGLEEDALAYDGSAPFTDTDSPYAGYAYAEGLTRGVTATTFNPNGSLSARNYVTFLLRALGYDDSQGDFSASDSLTFAASLTLMTGDAAEKLASLTLNRGDMVDLSYAALTCKMKDGDSTLAEKLRDDGVFTQAEGEEASVLGENAGWVYDYTPKDSQSGSGTGGSSPAVGTSGINYAKQTVSTSGGSVTAHVIVVDPQKTTIKTALVNNTIGATAPFSQIVQNSGASVVINGNFFNSYDAFKTPIGHVMVNGEFLYATSGLSSFGFTDDGQIKVGRPAVFTRVRSGENTWAAYEVNVPAQVGSVLYTPAYGQQVNIQKDGFVMTVQNNAITAYSPVAPGSVLTVPSGGFLMFMDTEFTSTHYFRQPSVGGSVSIEYYLFTEDAEGFTLDGVTSIVSGGPRLVQDGAAVTTLDPGFEEARFTTAVSPRTAIGVNGQGNLVLVSVPAATIQQMREVMLSLNCVDAINLDGGASCGMYCNGTYLATPGRELTVTLQVFPK